MIDPKIPLASVIIFSIFLATVLGQGFSSPTETLPDPVDEPLFTAPYDNFVVTQGPHGFSYGHMAVDLSAGNGAKIKSPIYGVVSEKYIDGLGNTTLVIENEYYKVLLMHGEYSVFIEEEVKGGQTIGTESNIGYTIDLQGRSCKDRNCGYHSHINVYDKVGRKNINPLNLIDD